MNAILEKYCNELTSEFHLIPEERKNLLRRLTDHIRSKVQSNEEINLIYICTHNSRRSHFGQVWSAVAARYYMIPNVKTFSGGTEATAFNPQAIGAVERSGLVVKRVSEFPNPEYHVFFDENEDPIVCFSKVYYHPSNPQRDFIAVMTCSDAEENCPFIPGANHRIATTYEDPKLFDGTPMMESKYDERCRQIALETLFVFSEL